MRENWYKVLPRWNLTTFQLSKMYSNNYVCWKCGSQNTSILIYGGSVKRLKDFGKWYKKIKYTMHIIVPLTPHIFLLGWIERKNEYKHLLIHLVTAASMLLANYWKNESVPS